MFVKCQPKRKAKTTYRIVKDVVTMTRRKYGVTTYTQLQTTKTSEAITIRLTNDATYQLARLEFFFLLIQHEDQAQLIFLAEGK